MCLYHGACLYSTSLYSSQGDLTSSRTNLPAHSTLHTTILHHSALCVHKNTTTYRQCQGLLRAMNRPTAGMRTPEVGLRRWRHLSPSRMHTCRPGGRAGGALQACGGPRLHTHLIPSNGRGALTSIFHFCREAGHMWSRIPAVRLPPATVSASGSCQLSAGRLQTGACCALPPSSQRHNASDTVYTHC